VEIDPKRHRVIDGSRSIEEVHGDVLNAIAGLKNIKKKN